ncbi:MAG: DUF3093 domain-containing protein [Propionibacteriales bacterium]|nr:DUF3093 domain-containing protein [Propionibacteriales bacterium]
MDDAMTPYTETLRVPAAWWLLGAGLVVSVWWVLVVATSAVVAVTGGAGALVTVVAGLSRYGAVQIVADQRGLSVGRAHLPWEYVGTATALGRDERRRATGVEADARAYVVLRAYCPGAVQVAVLDDVDPAPYWLVSSRRPDDLAARLARQAVQD